MNWPLTICLLTTIYKLTNALNPIIIVSGIFYNALEGEIAENADIDPRCRPRGAGPFRLYLEPKYLIENGLECLYDGIELYYNSTTHTTSNRRGVDVRAKMDISFLETIDEEKNIPMFKVMIDFLAEKFGYTRNVSIFGAPYDFRKGPREPEVQAFCIRFKRMIRTAFIMNRGKKVILLYYSLGAKVTLFCLRGYTQQFKDKHILIMISIAGVYGGTTKIIDLLRGVRFYGTEFATRPDNIFSNRHHGQGVNPAFLQELLGKVPTAATSIEVMPGRSVRNFTSIPWLAPTEEAFKTQVIARTRSKNYTAQNLREYYVDMGGEGYAQIFDDSYNYTDIEPPAGIKIYCMYGYNVPTLLTINHMGDTPNSQKSYPTNGDGDGLVNVQGANCKLLKRKPEDEPIVMMPFKNHNHGSILFSKKVFDSLADIISSHK